MSADDLVQAIAVTAELTGTRLSDAGSLAMAAQLASFPREQVLEALERCQREMRTRLTLADVIARIDDGRPGPEEAWAMMPKDEATSVVWSEEMAHAFGVAGPLLAQGDAIAARMAFKEAYAKLVAEARDAGEPVQWTASLGHDPRGRDAALADAVDKGRLTLAEARGYSPGLPAPHSARDLERLT